MLTITSVQAQTYNAQVTNTAQNLIVRRQPSVESAVLGYVRPSQQIAILGRSDDTMWLETRATNGLVGWVASEYVRLDVDMLALPVTHQQNQFGMNANLSPDVITNVQRIYRRGQALGNDAHVFSKVGDSITYSSAFLAPIGAGRYELGGFGYLQETIDYFMIGEARRGNSFSNPSLAARIGWTAPAVLTPRYAEAPCYVSESPLVCEYRLNKPTVALIMFGTNDIGTISPHAYYANLERIIQESVEYGVIPIVSTIPPRTNHAAQVAHFNGLVEYLANGYQVPLWDYHAAMVNLPNQGLDVDGVHPNSAYAGNKGAADFTTTNLYAGYVVRNLTALQMLDAVRRAIEAMGQPVVES